jgi:hypothetical protein
VTARRLLAAATLAALAACSSTTAPPPGLNLNTPSALAVFRGVTTAHPQERRHPYLAIASSGANELDLLDAVTATIIPGPFPLRGLAYPVAETPTLLVASDLGDDRPDLLVVASAGGSSLQIVRTWRPDGAVVGEVPLPADVRGLVALDPDVAGTVQLAAMLSDERVALVTFRRATASADPDAIDTVAARASVQVSGGLGFRPVSIAKSPVRGQVWFATRDDLGGGTYGVKGVDLASMTPDGALATSVVVSASAAPGGAPTRLVAAAAVRERPANTPFDQLTATLVDPAAIGTLPVVNRVYAVLDESGCGVDAGIPCGLVALDPGTGTVAADPTLASSLHATSRAPIQIPGPLSLTVAGPPAVGPPDDPRFATSISMRVLTSAASRAATAVMAVTSTDGTVWFVDLTSWEVPSHQVLQSSMAVSAGSYQPPPAAPPIPRNQWLVLHAGADPAHLTTAIKHNDLSGIAAAVTVTPGYTPVESWAITKQGVLPNLSLRKAEVGTDGGLALQSGGGRGDVVRVWDPTLGIEAGDIVVIDAVGVGTCGEFEAVVTSVEAPTTTPARPGGFLRLGYRVPAAGEPDAARADTWRSCLDQLNASAASGAFDDLYVTIRAADYVLVRGTGVGARAVGRPRLDQFFQLTWGDETPGAAPDGCVLPPARAWPSTGFPDPCNAACRARCSELVRIHHARRLSYVPEPCLDPAICGPSGRWPVWPDPTGPAIGFTLALESSAPAHRDLQLVLATSDGRLPDRATLLTGATTNPRASVPYDRSRDATGGDMRFFVVYPAGHVIDVGCSDSSGVYEVQ